MQGAFHGRYADGTSAATLDGGELAARVVMAIAVNGRVAAGVPAGRDGLARDAADGTSAATAGCDELAARVVMAIAGNGGWRPASLPAAGSVRRG